MAAEPTPIPVRPLAAAAPSSIHFDGCDWELTTFQALKTYGVLHHEPENGGVYVRLILKVSNNGDSPKRVDFNNLLLIDPKGRRFSYCGVADPFNTTEIQPGFNFKGEIVFMIPVDVVFQKMTLLLVNDSWAERQERPVQLPRLTQILEN